MHWVFRQCLLLVVPLSTHVHDIHHKIQKPGCTVLHHCQLTTACLVCLVTLQASDKSTNPMERTSEFMRDCRHEAILSLFDFLVMHHFCPVHTHANKSSIGTSKIVLHRSIHDNRHDPKLLLITWSIAISVCYQKVSMEALRRISLAFDACLNGCRHLVTALRRNHVEEFEALHAFSATPSEFHELTVPCDDSSFKVHTEDGSARSINETGKVSSRDCSLSSCSTHCSKKILLSYRQEHC
mmetsp:Transcript_71579/g.113415  ORF Transcript_71579/g.113415 Transcript_71579/m.113415 type:complete len:240 (-) Transcript_71579:860-1579(-)